MRIVCLSDTHSRQGQGELAKIPDGDVLLHAGDLTMVGELDEIEPAFAWLNALPHKHVIFTPGNHDYAFQTEPASGAISRASFRALPY